jgi:hypothetical protein
MCAHGSDVALQSLNDGCKMRPGIYRGSGLRAPKVYVKFHTCTYSSGFKLCTH